MILGSLNLQIGISELSKLGKIRHGAVVPVPQILWSIICVIKIVIVLRKMNLKIQQHDIHRHKIENTIQLIDYNMEGRAPRFRQRLNFVIRKFVSLSFV